MQDRAKTLRRIFTDFKGESTRPTRERGEVFESKQICKQKDINEKLAAGGSPQTKGNVVSEMLQKMIVIEVRSRELYECNQYRTSGQLFAMQTNFAKETSSGPGEEDLCLFVYGRSKSAIDLASRQLTGERCGCTTNKCGGDTDACFKPRFAEMRNDQFRKTHDHKWYNCDNGGEKCSHQVF